MKASLILTAILSFSLAMLTTRTILEHKIDPALEFELQKLDCVAVAWVEQKDGFWHAEIICDKDENNFRIEKKAFFKFRLIQKIKADLKRHTFCNI